MAPGLTFWIVAWCVMGIAFVVAFLAIVLGAHGLDRGSRLNESDHFESKP